MDCYPGPVTNQSLSFSSYAMWLDHEQYENSLLMMMFLRSICRNGKRLRIAHSFPHISPIIMGINPMYAVNMGVRWSVSHFSIYLLFIYMVYAYDRV